MATLNSPGVSVTVIDESFYNPASPGTVPLLFVASAQDKTNASGTIAAGTTAANAGKLWLMTSQRDLADTFGVPHFYTDASSNPLHGDELNEYGLQAAYSVLGVSSRAYVVRADIDTSALIPKESAPSGKPYGGQYWVDTNDSKFGIKEWQHSTLSFVDKTPIVFDDNTDVGSYKNSDWNQGPDLTIGQAGDYCIIITMDNSFRIWYKQPSTTTWVVVRDGYGPPGAQRSLIIGPHYQVPNWNSSTIDKSVWVVTTKENNGASWKIKRYNSSAQGWDTLSTPMYADLPTAIAKLDTVGGKNIPVGSVFVEDNFDNFINPDGIFKVWRRNSTGPTSITSDSQNYKTNQWWDNATGHLTTATFKIRYTVPGSTAWSALTTINITPASYGSNSGTSIASLIPAAIAGAGLPNISSTYNALTDQITITHLQGGDFELVEVTNNPITLAGIGYTTANVIVPPTYDYATYLATGWASLDFQASADAPYNVPADGTLWYDSVHDQVDILYHNGTTWVGYHNAFPNTDPNGPIVSATEPLSANGQSDSTPLVNGDIWISTADIEMYGKNIYVYSTTAGWVAQDTTDQSTSNGWLFADVRWATTGTSLTASNIYSLIRSDYLDPDTPDPAIYPRGMRLWNTRRSGFNVKKYISGHIDIYANNGLNARYPHNAGESMDTSGHEYAADRWVSQHNVAADGSGVFGRHAQRAQLVQAFKSTIDTNAIIRDTDTVNFNLMATPGYSEVIQNMVALNIDRGQTAFIVGDTPFRLMPTGTELSNWGLNTAQALDNGDEGAVTYDEYLALYYPSGYTNDNTGNYIVVPPSHMMLRTIINSDAKSFQWFAPAGTRRGGVDNATSVGYITSEGEFKSTPLSQGIRDVMLSPSTKVAINPIATLAGVGIVAYGQRTRAKNASSLDRINVARLVCYLRRQLDVLARPFLFEPNDAQTRREIKAAAESLMLELVGQRALYDYVVVCDETNNTAARIDRNELYMDIAIEPVKAVEFIYIPLRLKNTGDIKAGL